VGVYLVTINLDNCLNTGTIEFVSGDSVSKYGMIAGNVTSKTYFNAVYTVKQDDIPPYDGTTRTDLTFDLDDIKGSDAFRNMPDLFASSDADGVYNNDWVCVEDGTPVLATFAKYAGTTTTFPIDVTWYNEDSYQLVDTSDLYGFVALSRNKKVEGFSGKTITLAKAVAGEANVPFFSMSGSEFVEMFVGMGASKVRDLFKQAKEKAPCIVFIDEIDAIGQKRDGRVGGNDEREQTLNQLLTEMDGFEGNTGVIILAATNRPETLDPALTRPGRFDRRVPVELPDLKGREAILKVHAKKIKVMDDVDFSHVARMASGASGAELANIINEAALSAVRSGRKAVTQADLEESIEVVIAGYEKKNAILTDKEKMIVAYHEIGHALVAAKQSHSAPVQKITIVPRTSGALGYTMQVEEGNHYLMSKEEIENKIATYTGGRVAEEIAVGSISTGASNDIEQATKLARAMITRYGMSEDFGMVALETVNNRYLGGDASLACSADTQTEIDRQVVALVKEQYNKAKQILTDNKGKLDELAKYLYINETITGDEFMNILNS